MVCFHCQGAVDLNLSLIFQLEQFGNIDQFGGALLEGSGKFGF